MYYRREGFGCWQAQGGADLDELVDNCPQQLNAPVLNPSITASNSSKIHALQQWSTVGEETDQSCR
ncbi:MAG: hypothetical protein ACPLSM_07670 [Thermosphaera sp.]